jgi:hypothetical protein
VSQASSAVAMIRLYPSKFRVQHPLLALTATRLTSLRMNRSFFL